MASYRQPDARTDTTLLMTTQGVAELQAELQRLRERGRQEIVERLREARSFGDDSNNDDIHAIREEEAILEVRIASLEDVLARAVLVDIESGTQDVVALGSNVTVEDLESARVTSYRIAGAHEPIARNQISAGSPMGQALMGSVSGDVVSVALPSGRSVRVRVVEVLTTGAARRPAA